MAENRSDAIHREMYRKSMDSIRVYNPTQKDFVVEWDGFKHIVPSSKKDMGFGRGQRILSRYLAEKYARDMKDHLINTKNNEEITKLIDDQPRELRAKYETDPYERQALWNRLPRTDDPKKIKEIYEVIWMGVEERYGLDQAETDENDGRIDPRTIEEQVLASLEKPYVKKEEKVEPTKVESKKAKLSEEVQA